MGAPNITARETTRAEKWRRKGLSWAEIGEKVGRTPQSLSRAVFAKLGVDPYEEEEAVSNGSNGASAAPKKKTKKRKTKGWVIGVRFNGREVIREGVTLEKATAIMGLLESE